MKLYSALLFTFLFINTITWGQMVMDLYSVIPNSKPCNEKETYTKNNGGIGIVAHVTHPTLQVFLPKVMNPAASSIIICPGGGYSVLAIDHEGIEVAKAFNTLGIAAFVLKYRIPDLSCMDHRENVPLMDAQQALKIVRQNAVKWKIDTTKIGVMGFSAGGHLASSLATHFNDQVISNPDHTSLRPDFAVLIYPVISFKDSITHKGSRENLIGKTPSLALVHRFSNEEQITSKTPPAFLVHAVDDDAVPVANSISFGEALAKNKVPVEMHLYQNGGHGYGLHNKTTKDEWMERLKNWLGMNGFLK
ncbi:MAG: alpha/beta hydrolase [Segetibacter sp.]